MEAGKTARGYLTKKIEILKKIAANTETQSRFIHKREMTGLGRVLGEREVLLAELRLLSGELAREESWKKEPTLAPMILLINQQEGQVIARSTQVVGEAEAELAFIATELKSNRLEGQVQSRYLNPWATMTGGRLFNERG